MCLCVWNKQKRSCCIESFEKDLGKLNTTEEKHTGNKKATERLGHEQLSSWPRNQGSIIWPWYQDEDRGG